MFLSISRERREKKKESGREIETGGKRRNIDQFAPVRCPYQPLLPSVAPLVDNEAGILVKAFPTFPTLV